jgi:CRISPR-associated endoribonuclease Cas6
MVRISCDFKVDELPVSYNMMFVSIIKEALKASNKEYFENLYNFGEDKSNKQSKNFTFAVFINDFEKVGDIFKVNGNVSLSISSPDHEFMIYLYNGFTAKKNYQYKNYSLDRTRFMVIEEKKILGGEAIIKALSPICIKDRNNKFMQMDDPEFNTELNYISNVVLTNYRGYGLNENLNLEPLNCKKRVVKEKIRNFEEISKKDILYVNAYVGIFRLKGSREDLNDLYKLGLGNRRSQGFGMIDIY